MIQRLYRHPQLFGMALMAPAVLVIFVLHLFTAGRLHFYLDSYIYLSYPELVGSVCRSVELDLIYSAAYISFFLVVPLALASRLGLAVLEKLHQSGESYTFANRVGTQFRGSMRFVVVFIVVHATSMPLLLCIPLGRPLWVEHNFARNVVFVSVVFALIAVPLQIIQACAFSAEAAARHYPLPPTHQPRRSFPLLVGTPLAGIAFWLMSALFVLSLFSAVYVVFGKVSYTGFGGISTLCALLLLSSLLAATTGQLLGIWRCSLRAFLVIIFVTVLSQFSSSLAFPIDWREACTVWTD